MWMGLSGGDNVPGTALLVCLDSQRAHPKRTPLRLDNAHFSWWVNQWGTSASGLATGSRRDSRRFSDTPPWAYRVAAKLCDRL